MKNFLKSELAFLLKTKIIAKIFSLLLFTFLTIGVLVIFNIEQEAGTTKKVIKF